MQNQKLGNNGLEVSVLGLGCMGLIAPIVRLVKRRKEENKCFEALSASLRPTAGRA